MSKTLVMTHVDAFLFCKRQAVIKSDVTVLYIAQGKSGKLFCADSVTEDESRQLRISAPVKMSNTAEDISCSVKSNDFSTIMEAVMSYDSEADIIITQNASVLKISTKGSNGVSLEVPLVAQGKRIEGINKETLKFQAQVKKTDLAKMFSGTGRYFDPEGRKGELLKCLEMKVAKDSILLDGNNGFNFGCQTVPASVVADGDVDEVLSLPGAHLDVLKGVIGTSEMEKVNILADDKYIHVMFAAGCLASVRMSDKVMDFSKFRSLLRAEPSVKFTVDKARMEKSISVLNKKVALSKTVVPVPVKITGNDKELNVSIGNNQLTVPLVSGSAEGVDIYASTSVLGESLASQENGNILCAIVGESPKNVVVIGNGDDAEGFKIDACLTLMTLVPAEQGAKRQSEFLSGDDTKKADKKAADKKAAEPKEESEEVKTA